MKHNTTIALFEKYAKDYDKLQSGLVPYYDNIISMVANAFVRHVGGGDVLDLGCGTGNVSTQILSSSPKARVFLLDGSQSMMDVAVPKLAKKFGARRILGGRVVNLEDKNWAEGLGKFDAIVTSLVLEHLKWPDYRAVVRKCREHLKPGGYFISVEWSDDKFGMRQWFVDEMDARRNMKSKYHKQASRESRRMERHYFVDINKKLEWIKNAGFKDVHTIWQYLFGYIVVGRK